ncbi:MAG: SPFH domain-containing protein [Anaerolineae bacterium]
MAILEVIEWADPGTTEMVHRVPEWGSAEFRLGSQLIVREHQSAVFYDSGRALDEFGPGRYTLRTDNIPILADILGIPFGGKTPFRTEVYFVSRRAFLDLKWGTPEPIALRDPDLGVVRLRAFGTFATAIADPRLFVTQIVGGQGLYSTSDILGYLRGIVVSRLTDLLGESGVGLFDLPSHYEELSASLTARLRDDFEALGLELRDLYLTNVSTTAETQKAIDERAAMGAIGDVDAYLKFKAARALESSGSPGGEGSGTAAAGLGLGAGIGLGTVLAQMMGQAMQPGAPATAADPSTERREATLDDLFTGLQVLAQRQLALEQSERTAIVSELAALRLALEAQSPDLDAIRDRRASVEERWPWLGPEIEEAFRQPAVTAALVRAASDYTAG